MKRRIKYFPRILFPLVFLSLVSFVGFRAFANEKLYDVWKQPSAPVSSALEITIARVEHAIDRTQRIHIHTGMPNWIKIHALLVYDCNGHSQSFSAVRRQELIDSLLLGGNGDLIPRFTVRRGKPWPRRTKEKFIEEDHRDQYLYLLSSAGVPLDAPLHVDEHRFKVLDLLDNSLAECRTSGDLSWTVAAYAHYLSPGQEWTNKFGERMTLGVLVKALLENNSRVCGGTHALGAMALVLSRPEWKTDPEIKFLRTKLDRHVRNAVDLLKEHQLQQGSFRMANGELPHGILEHPYARDVHYTGHCLEWLTLALSDEQLREDWIIRAVDYLAKILSEKYYVIHAAEITNMEKRYTYGAVCHAISGLRRWHSRVIVCNTALEKTDKEVVDMIEL